jgi:hypothetical protein
MTMGPRLRKLGLTVHVATSVGWLGAIAAYLALNAVALRGEDVQAVRAAYLMMEPVAWYAVVPLAIASLVTGIAQSLGTSWGLFRHYWVLISLAITALATLVLLLHMRDISHLAYLAADPATDPIALGGDLVHAAGGLVVLLVPLVLNIVKPRGLTRHGQRQQDARQAKTSPQKPAR